MSSLRFECAVCLETKKELREKLRTVGDDCICAECALEMIPLFEQALQNEIYYPPRWGRTEISFNSFADLFSDDFCVAYRNKLKEYKTPKPKRVYCQHRVPTSKDGLEDDSSAEFCNNFLGSSELEGLSQCDECTNWMCMDCRDVASTPLYRHACDTSKADSDSKAFDQKTKNKEWQSCPNPACGLKIGLRDGCNAMLCACGTDFCFICGEKAAHDGNHWMVGNPCPRWGAIDAATAMFDQPAQAPAVFPFPVRVPVEMQIANELEPVLVDDVRLRITMGLHRDNDEAQTILEEFDAELADGDFWGDQRKTMLEMRSLLKDFHDNMMHLTFDWTATLMAPLFLGRATLENQVREAVESTNFFIRDGKLQTKMFDTLTAARAVAGVGSVLRDMPVMQIFDRYTIEHRGR